MVVFFKCNYTLYQSLWLQKPCFHSIIPLQVGTLKRKKKNRIWNGYNCHSHNWDSLGKHCHNNSVNCVCRYPVHASLSYTNMLMMWVARLSISTVCSTTNILQTDTFCAFVITDARQGYDGKAFPCTHTGSYVPKSSNVLHVSRY